MRLRAVQHPPELTSLSLSRTFSFGNICFIEVLPLFKNPPQGQLGTRHHAGHQLEATQAFVEERGAQHQGQDSHKPFRLVLKSALRLGDRFPNPPQ